MGSYLPRNGLPTKRRMQPSEKEAVNLFPEVQSNHLQDRREAVDKPGYFKMSVPVSVQDDEGRQWPVVLECLLTADQRHVRLVKGWTDMYQRQRIFRRSENQAWELGGAYGVARGFRDGFNLVTDASKRGIRNKIFLVKRRRKSFFLNYQTSSRPASVKTLTAAAMRKH